MVPWSSFVGLRFTFRFVEFSSQLWWFPGFLEAPRLQLRDLPYGEAPGAHRAAFQQKMLLFCFHPMTKVNTWAVSSIFRGVFRSGFKTHEWRQHVSASIEPRTPESGRVPVFSLGGAGERAVEVPSSGEFHNRGLRSLKRSLFCLKMFTESQARKQNKTALLVSGQWERKATHFSMLPFKVTSATLTDSWN